MERYPHPVAGMRGLHQTAQTQLHLVRSHHNLHRGAGGKGQRHFKVTSSRTQIAEVRIVAYRTSLLVNLSPQTACISGLSAAVAGFVAQPGDSFSLAAIYV